MIDREHGLPITKQAEVLNISRGSVYYLPRLVPERDLAIMRRMDQLHMDYLRLPKGRNIFVAGITVHPDQGDMTFTVGKPRYRITRKTEAFSFLGFAPKTVVDIDFVRQEEERLTAAPLGEYLKRNSKAPRPPAGHIV